ncbi:NEDD8-conjugating protein ubc12 [Coemansia thaxteri]|uniref:NEDD8-conjugating enzyme UBC12 n=1 Tax=Coemansia thaxteri TaxID=2663907 RepID=A0A9W8EGT7_9FUNG|nr:NEDD8-conjugating protein ubc12 [Coemansia thaxteri]KAJ2009334.1 NEDD8-conjugating protein ubc12 [Coemansia thaxteri]KAJ2474083.1 NEDD8-conjugating protein ubc12 [Coemansia sp. RSA 2322]KAJ2476408.1 NEDD8-conjugating protein ubc12 [Coemansia sp. RSA 2320]
MLKLWNQKKTEAEAQRGKQRVQPSKIRLQKDLGELERDDNTDIVFDNVEDQTRFTVVYRPPAELYVGGEFRFSFEVSDSYPHEPPKVLCLQKIYHPNIDTMGHVCLNILREDWNPVLNIQAVIFGLQMLFMAPTPDDPLNVDAAQNMHDDLALFKRNIATSMRGGTINDTTYDYVLADQQNEARGRQQRH